MNTELDRQIDEHLREFQTTLESAGFWGRVGFGNRPCVVVVDFMRGFTDTSCPLAGSFDREVEVTRRLLDQTRRSNRPRVLVSSLVDEGVWATKIPANRWLVAGSEWVKLDERLEQAEGDLTIVKRYASCFFGTELLGCW